MRTKYVYMPDLGHSTAAAAAEGVVEAAYNYKYD